MKKNRKKKKYRLRKPIKISLIVLALAIAILVGYRIFDGMIEYNQTSFYDDIAYSSECDDTLDDDALLALTDFRDFFYYSQKHLPNNYSSERELQESIPDTTLYFSSNSYEQAYLWQSAFKLLITGKALNPNNMNYTHCSYDIEIDQVKFDGTTYSVAFRESCVVNFAYLSGFDSKTTNLYSEATISKDENDKWKLTSYYCDDDFYLAIYNNYNQGKTGNNAITTALDRVFSKAAGTYKDNLKFFALARKEYNSGQVSYSDKKWDYDYDRSAAENYIHTYAGKRNTDEYTSYDDLGGNCQNFASQVLYAGGIPMDITGKQVWKYYGDAYSDENNRQGRSGSWTTAPFFRKYALNNSGKGLVCTVDANIYSAEVGDLLQVGKSKSEIVHTNVVADVVTKGGDVVEVLLDSNTNDRINWPLSAGFSNYSSLIKINGYNE